MMYIYIYAYGILYAWFDPVVDVIMMVLDFKKPSTMVMGIEPVVETSDVAVDKIPYRRNSAGKPLKDVIPERGPHPFPQ